MPENKSRALVSSQSIRESSRLKRPVFAKSVVGRTGKSPVVPNTFPLNFPEIIRNGEVEKKNRKNGKARMKRYC
jgi:hypothetical protein